MKPLYYYQFKVSTDSLISYYNNNLKGDSKIGYDPISKEMSNKIDSFIEMEAEEQTKFSFFLFWDKINTKVSKYYSYDESKVIQLKTKLACAIIIQKARKIEKMQKLVWDQAKYKVHDFVNGIGYRANYSSVPENTWNDFRSLIDETHSEIERIRIKKIDDHFRNNAFYLFSNEISNAYPLFNLDYTPITKKIEDKSINCGIIVVGFILFVVLFGLMAKCATGNL